MALTKEAIIELLVTEHGLFRREATDILETVLDDIKQQCEEGARSRINTFGAFLKVRKRAPKKLQDKGVEYVDTIKFRPAPYFKGRVQRATIEISRDVD